MTHQINQGPKPGIRQSDENLQLPPNCFFVNETREELPVDPLELSKLKLIKQAALKNLNSEIRRIKQQSKGHQSKNEVESYKREIANLDVKLKDLSKRLQTMRELEKKNPNEG